MMLQNALISFFDMDQYYPAIKKEWNFDFHNNMDGHCDWHSHGLNAMWWQSCVMNVTWVDIHNNMDGHNNLQDIVFNEIS